MFIHNATVTEHCRVGGGAASGGLPLVLPSPHHEASSTQLCSPRQQQQRAATTDTALPAEPDTHPPGHGRWSRRRAAAARPGPALWLRGAGRRRRPVSGRWSPLPPPPAPESGPPTRRPPAHDRPAAQRHRPEQQPSRSRSRDAGSESGSSASAGRPARRAAASRRTESSPGRRQSRRSVWTSLPGNGGVSRGRRGREWERGRGDGCPDRLGETKCQVYTLTGIFSRHLYSALGCKVCQVRANIPRLPLFSGMFVTLVTAGSVSNTYYL